jgi:AraC-like DNA-binding protein
MMATRPLLWVVLGTTLSEPDLCSSLPKVYGAQRLRHLADLLQAVQNWRPWAVCFEYDVPDARGLAALAEVKTRHSSLPLVMLTEKHARKLETLAFRQCVWDYLVKPVSVRRLCNCLTSIDKAVPPTRRPVSKMPAAGTSINVLAGNPCAGGTLAPAVSYVATNYPDKLRLATAATLCDLSPFQFSRNFKREQGMTFRDFVVRVRIQRAAELLRRPAVSVTEAAFGVGFNDLSYFARMFRRQLGVSPSHYRTEGEPSQLPLFPPEEWRER